MNSQHDQEDVNSEEPNESEFLFSDQHPPTADGLSFTLVNQQDSYEVDESYLEDCVQQILTAQDRDTAELSIVLVDDQEIHQINRDHLGHDYPTDIVTFSYLETAPGPGSPIDGELMISCETAAAEATKAGWSFDQELTLYVIHGVLHLCGFDDLTPSEQLEMRREEKRMLELLEIEISKTDSRWEFPNS